MRLWTTLPAALALLASLVWAPGLAAAAPEGTITESSTLTAASEPAGIASGPEGNLWFTEYKGGRVARITPSGAITELLGPGPAAGRMESIVLGPEGNLWYTERHANAIGLISPAGSVAEFPVPTPASQPEDITLGPDGNLWFAELEGDKIGRIAPGGSITEFPVPTAESEPWAIVSGPEGNLWFTEFKADQIGRITPSGAITELPVTTSGSEPAGIAFGPEGDVWFTEFGADQIGRLSPSNGAVTEFPVPTAKGFPLSIAPGPEGDLWFTEFGADQIGRINPSNGVVSEFSVPTAEGRPHDIVPGPDGNMWFTESGGAKIGRIGTGAPEALAAAPTVTGGGLAGAAQTCAVSWSTWDSLQPSATLFGFDGYTWLLDGTQVATGSSYTPTTEEIGHTLTCAETVTYPLLAVTASATSAAVTVLAPPPPVITDARQTAATWREGSRLAQVSRAAHRRVPPVGTTFSFVLSERASVSFAFSGHAAGRRTDRGCATPRHGHGRRRACPRRATTAGRLTFAGRSGVNRVVFQGRLSRTETLAPGRYTVRILATNSEGTHSVPVSLRFTIAG